MEAKVGEATKSAKGLHKRGKSIRFSRIGRQRGRGPAVQLSVEFPVREAAGTWHGGEAAGRERVQAQGQRAEARGGSEWDLTASQASPQHGRTHRVLPGGGPARPAVARVAAPRITPPLILPGAPRPAWLFDHGGEFV